MVQEIRSLKKPFFSGSHVGGGGGGGACTQYFTVHVLYMYIYMYMYMYMYFIHFTL